MLSGGKVVATIPLPGVGDSSVVLKPTIPGRIQSVGDPGDWIDYAIQREDRTFCSVHMSAASTNNGGAIRKCEERAFVHFLQNDVSKVPLDPTDFMQVVAGEASDGLVFAAYSRTDAFCRNLYVEAFKDLFRTRQTYFAPMLGLEDPQTNVNLPSLIINAATWHDVMESVRLANEKGFRVSVKGAGHSYLAHNTAPNSVNINLNRYNHVGYFHGCPGAAPFEFVEDWKTPNAPSILVHYGPDAIEDCPGQDSEAQAKPTCRGKTSVESKRADLEEVDGESSSVLEKLCANRSFPGIIKTGPAETWYYAYQTAMANKVWIAAGSSGSVGSCGGFIGGTGLGFLTRTFGFTVDNLQALELVVPTGQHVLVGKHLPPVGRRREKEELFYYCNRSPDKDTKKWRVCTSKKDAESTGGSVDFPDLVDEHAIKAYFTDLFFAVRGGGSGAWGVFLACYYRAHQPQNKYNRIYQLFNNVYWSSLANVGYDGMFKDNYTSLANLSRRLLGMFVLRFINTRLYPQYAKYSTQFGYSDAWAVSPPGEQPGGLFRFNSQEARQFFLDEYANFLDDVRELSPYAALLNEADSTYAKLRTAMIAKAKSVPADDPYAWDRLPQNLFPESVLDWLKNDYYHSRVPRPSSTPDPWAWIADMPWFSDITQKYSGPSYLNAQYGGSPRIENEVLVQSSPGAHIKDGPYYKYFPAAYFGDEKTGTPRSQWEQEYLNSFPSWGLHGAGGNARRYGAIYEEEFVIRSSAASSGAPEFERSLLLNGEDDMAAPNAVRGSEYIITNFGFQYGPGRLALHNKAIETYSPQLQNGGIDLNHHNPAGYSISAKDPSKLCLRWPWSWYNNVMACMVSSKIQSLSLLGGTGGRH